MIRPSSIIYYQAFISVFYLVVIPLQLAFAGGSLVCLQWTNWSPSALNSGTACEVGGDIISYNIVFNVSYGMDGAFALCALLVVWYALPTKLKSAICCGQLFKSGGDSMHWSRVRDRLLSGSNDDAICSTTTASLLAVPMLQLLLAIPYDALLWSTPFASQFVPFLRLVRLYPISIVKTDSLLSGWERSQNVSFMIARYLRVLWIVCLVVHTIACSFIYATQQPAIASHYLSAPWMRAETGSLDSSTYLRSAYWALVTITTVGHADVIDEDQSRLHAATWEIFFCIIVILVATLLYIYITANFTSMMIRVYQNLEKYRVRVAHVESYLKRHRVRASLCRLVRQHVKASYENAGRDDDALLRELPRSLRRELMIDINMRTLRTAPIFLGCDSAMISLVCSMLTRVTFLREELIHKQGDVVRELLILESGTIMYTISPPEEEDDEQDDPSMGGSSTGTGGGGSDAGDAPNVSDGGEGKVVASAESGLAVLGDSQHSSFLTAPDSSFITVDGTPRSGTPPSNSTPPPSTTLLGLGSLFGAGNGAPSLMPEQPSGTKGESSPQNGEVIVRGLEALGGLTSGQENVELLSARDEEENTEEGEEAREAARQAATRKEILRLTGTCICEMAFLFGLRQEGDLHALSKTTCAQPYPLSLTHKKLTATLVPLRPSAAS